MRLCALLVMWVMLMGFGSSTVMADDAGAHADTHKADSKAGHAAAGHEKEPIQKQFGLTRWDLGIYTLVIFGLLVGILGKFAWGPMIGGLDQREAGLLKLHTDAESARAESQKALAEIQTRLAKANEEVRAMLEEARRDAQAVKDQLKAEASAESQAERERGRREIEMAKDQALKEIYEQAVSLASLVSTKAIKRELTPSDHARLVDEALTDLKQTLSKT